jgi:hypothetical protein
MTVQFDIFRTEADGSVVWRGTAAALEEAKAIVRKMAASSPGTYVVMNLQTGNKLAIHSDMDDGAVKFE